MISVQTKDFDVGKEYLALRNAQNQGTGAIVTFTGLVRDFGDQTGVTGLELEHYPGMTEQSLATIASEATKRWDINGYRIIHRVGKLALHDQIVFVGVSSAHRVDAFEAAAFIMDYLKTRAPFWKKERSQSASAWVDAKDSDQQLAERWQKE